MENTMTSALVPADANGTDLQTARQKSEAVAVVEAQVFMAKQYPRNEDRAYQKIMATCSRPAFAVDATFEFPRGGETVSGGSIHLAREMKRHWGNMISSTRIVRDDGETVYAEAFAWDLETNAYASRQFQVSKYIWKRAKWKNGRKVDDGRFVLVAPRPSSEDEKDLERDLREKVANIGSRAERVCIFQLIPYDFLADAEQAARETVRSGMKQDPEAMRKLVLRSMAKLSIDAEQIEEYLGCKVAKASPKQIDELRAIYQKISSGEATWNELTSHPAAEPIFGEVGLDDLVESEEPNRGHGAANPDHTPESEEAPESAPPPTAEQQDDLNRLRAGRARVERLGGITESMRRMVKSWIGTEGDPTEAYINRAIAEYEGSDDDLRQEMDALAGESLKQEDKSGLFGKRGKK